MTQQPTQPILPILPILPVQPAQPVPPIQPNIKPSQLVPIFQKHEINPQIAQKLQTLQSFKIVFIFDDSGSMNSTDTGKMTRWEELLQFASASSPAHNVQMNTYVRTYIHTYDYLCMQPLCLCTYMHMH